MKLLLVLTVLSWGAAAQTFDGIRTPVSRTVTLSVHEAAFTFTIVASLDSTVQQVKEILQNAGLPNPTLVATGLVPDNSVDLLSPPRTLYFGTAAIPAPSAPDTVRSLEALRLQLPDPLRSLEYSVTFNPEQRDVDATRQAVMPQLMDDSRKAAQSLATATGVKVGAIRSVSDLAGGYGFNGSGAGSPSNGGSLLASFSVPSSMPYTYYLTVVFAVQ